MRVCVCACVCVCVCVCVCSASLTGNFTTFLSRLAFPAIKAATFCLQMKVGLFIPSPERNEVL